MVKIVSLEDIDIKKFWEYVYSDIAGYFFFILDQKQYPESSQFLIAVDNGNIVGLCLIWKKRTIQIRSQDETIVKALFHAIPKDIPFKEINFEYKYRELLHSLFPNPKHKMDIHRMVLQKDNMIPRLTLDKPYTKRILTQEDASDIVKLMKKADSVYWGEVKADQLTIDENLQYTGLYDGKKLISFVSIWLDESAAIIPTAATHPKYQNQGLATYLVNESVHRMMEHTEIAIIHVITSNKPANKVYSKVGYEVYTTYAMVALD